MQPFKPAWWLPHAHAQTIWASWVRKAPQVETNPEFLELDDGDFLDLRWTLGKQGPIVIVLHGLEGCIESNYIQGVLAAVHQKGWRGVLMHFRNCGYHTNRLPQSYHAGQTHDLACLVDLLLQREPQTPLAVIGYSLGGNVLLKWMAESGSNLPIQAAVAVSVPFELEKAMRRLEKGFSRIYHWYFLRLLRRSALRKSTVLPLPFTAGFIKAIPSIREFDDRITAPLHGFRGVDHYYATASCRPYLKAIQIPTLIIHAKDDPFMTPDAIPRTEEMSSLIKLELLPRGGHVGFIGGKWPWKSIGWLDQRIPQYLEMQFNLSGSRTVIGKSNLVVG